MKINRKMAITEYGEKKTVFSQGDPADAVFYVRQGKIKLSVTSKQGKLAVLAILDSGSFVGEGCLAGQPFRMSTAATMEKCSLIRIEKDEMVRLLHTEPDFSEAFARYLVSRAIRVEEDLVDQLFNSSEKRLARILLLLAQFGKPGQPQPIIPKVSQETLAAMVGTTRPRINRFMTKFRKLGFIEYNDTLEVHSSLLNVVLHD
jgi:CRP/FNR family cyclic AMP-dependent transcriptional regulator